MDKKFERNIIWTLAIILILLGLFGCAKPKIDSDKKETVTVLDSIGNMEGIADALGCIFAVDNPACSKKEPQELHTK
jgi:hypothetical protein